jgi:1-deoxy-D-xylulose-5-phosphate synthase
MLAPRDTTELRQMTVWMKDYDKGPSAMRYPRGSSDDRLPEGRSPIELGRSEILREGKHITIVAVGSMVSVAWEATQILAQQGIEAGVINSRFLKPIDADAILDRASASGRLITIEENVQRGGFGEAVRDAVANAGLHAKIDVRIMALPDAFVEHGAQPIIRKECRLCADSVVALAQSMLSGSPAPRES